MTSIRHYPRSVCAIILIPLVAVILTAAGPFAFPALAAQNTAASQSQDAARAMATAQSTDITDTCIDSVESGESIQEAIDAAASGDVICVGSGTYPGQINISTSGITLRADDASVPEIENGTYGILVANADNVTIDGFIVRDFNNDGIRVENSAGVVIRNNDMTNNGKAVSSLNAPRLHITGNILNDQRLAFRQGFGIEITESDSVLIDLNTISENPSDGIRLLQSRHIAVQNNEINANNGTGVHLLESDSVVVAGNMIVDGGTHGIYLEESIGIIIQDNTITDNRLHGILMEEFSHQASLLGNTLSGHDADIYMVESAYATINDNSMGTGIVIDPDNIRSDFEAGQTHYNHSMQNNTVNGGQLYYGKDITADDVPAGAQQVIIHNSDNISLSGFSFSDVAIGLQISYSENVTLTNITAENHTFTGVRLVVSEGATILESEFNGNENDGLFLESSPQSLVENSNATGNGGSGMVYFWSENSAFDGNTATGNGENGIYNWNSHDGTVINNTATENGTGIVVSRSARSVASNNTANDNIGTGLSVGLVRNPQVIGNTALRNGANGISTGNLEGTGSISGNIMTHNQGNGLVVGTRRLVSSNIVYENNTIRHNERHGVRINSTNSATITGNIIEENSEYGIYIGSDASGAVIEENTIVNNDLTGIYMDNRLADSAQIEGNTLSGHPVDIHMAEIRRRQGIHDNIFETGILIVGEISENYDHFINGNTVNGKELFYSRGDTLPQIPADPGQIIIFNGGYVVVEELTFEGVAAGVQVGFSDTLIVRNTTFEGMQVGLNATGTELVTIEENTFSGNDTGVLIQGEYAPIFFADNEFLSNTVGLDAGNLNPGADARNNWWGSGSGPSGGGEDPETGTMAEGSGDAIAGTIRFDPWLGQGTIPTDAGGSGDRDERPGDNDLPAAFDLAQNYPNPFNPATQIRYSLPEQAQVRLDVYNTLGQRVKSLVDENQGAGSYEISFDATALSSGLYIYRIQAGAFSESRSMLLVK